MIKGAKAGWGREVKGLQWIAVTELVGKGSWPSASMSTLVPMTTYLL